VICILQRSLVHLFGHSSAGTYESRKLVDLCVRLVVLSVDRTPEELQCVVLEG